MIRLPAKLVQFALRAEALTLALTVLVIAGASAWSPRFADLDFLLFSATFFAEYGLVALLMTMLIISGEIDLSVASQIALNACCFGVMQEAGLPVGAAIAATLLVGAVLGGINALIIVRFGLPALIATIGTLTLFRGAAQVLLGDRSVTQFPAWWYGIDYNTLGGIPLSLIVFLVAAVLCALVLHGTKYGRWIYQIGVNASAARRVGVPAGTIRATLYVATGVTCAIAGLMMSSRLGSVRYDLATGGELQIVVIAVLGGAAITGGTGSILGAFSAFWLLMMIQTAMILENVGAEIQLAVIGVVLILSLSIPNVLRALSDRRNLRRAVSGLKRAEGTAAAKRRAS